MKTVYAKDIFTKLSTIESIMRETISRSNLTFNGLKVVCTNTCEYEDINTPSTDFNTLITDKSVQDTILNDNNIVVIENGVKYVIFLIKREDFNKQKTIKRLELWIAYSLINKRIIYNDNCLCYLKLDSQSLFTKIGLISEINGSFCSYELIKGIVKSNPIPNGMDDYAQTNGMLGFLALYTEEMFILDSELQEKYG